MDPECQAELLDETPDPSLLPVGMCGQPGPGPLDEQEAQAAAGAAQDDMGEGLSE